MRVKGVSLGCKVNTYEIEFILSKFKERNYEITSDTADVYVINTCSVTNMSDAKSRKVINRIVRENPNACIVVMGCMIEANKDYENNGISIIIGNKDKNKVVELTEEYLKNKEKKKLLYKDFDTDFEDMFITDMEGRTRAFVKIQDGCENFCTYCIIPYTRGKCRSKKKDKVIKEVEELVKIKELKRLRISSIEITELDKEFLDILQNNDVIVSHLHIPLQSGSDKILKLMNRKYDREFFKNKIDEIRRIRPNISITTDIIVGFPNENDDDFRDTCDFAKEIGFSKIHVFPYSRRRGTKADLMDNQVKESTKKERVDNLIKISDELEINYLESFINKKVEVLIEQIIDNKSIGHTPNYLKVEINGIYEKNTLIKVIINKRNGKILEGDRID